MNSPKVREILTEFPETHGWLGFVLFSGPATRVSPIHCMHRLMPITFSSPCRSRIPEHVDHRFQAMPIRNGGWSGKRDRHGVEFCRVALGSG